MSRKLVVTFDEHDYDQLILLAKMNKLRTQELVRRICRAHLDKGKTNLREERE